MSIVSYGPGAFGTVVTTSVMGSQQIYVAALGFAEFEALLARQTGLFGTIEFELLAEE